MPDFRSDNTHPASPEIVDAVARANSGNVSSYGEDPLTESLRRRCSGIFETEVDIFPVISGTAGNALALAGLTRASAEIYCHEDAHIHRDERGAAEFFSGARLVTLPGALGKLEPATLASSLDAAPPPAGSTLSLTQATEAGTVYSLDELRTLAEIAKSHALGLHMDGARFTNALVSLGCTPADLTWRLGIDILTFGAAKNGVLAAELIVVFRRELSRELVPRWHRSGHRPSKLRFLSAQLEAWLSGDVWLRNARHANAAARRLAERLAGVDGVELLRPVEANAVFLRLAPKHAAALEAANVLLYDWPIFGPDAYRAVAGFTTTEEDVDAFVEALSP